MKKTLLFVVFCCFQANVLFGQLQELRIYEKNELEKCNFSNKNLRNSSCSTYNSKALLKHNNIENIEYVIDFMGEIKDVNVIFNKTITANKRIQFIGRSAESDKFNCTFIIDKGVIVEGKLNVDNKKYIIEIGKDNKDVKMWYYLDLSKKTSQVHNRMTDYENLNAFTSLNNINSLIAIWGKEAHDDTFNSTTGIDLNAPIFHGSYDWHSSVHGHYAANYAGHFLDDYPTYIDSVNSQFTPANVEGEINYISNSTYLYLERQYGMPWLLNYSTFLDDTIYNGVSNPLQSLVEHCYNTSNNYVVNNLNTFNDYSNSVDSGYYNYNWQLLNLYIYAEKHNLTDVMTYVTNQLNNYAASINWDTVSEGDFFDPKAIAIMLYTKAGLKNTVAWNNLMQAYNNSSKALPFTNLKFQPSHKAGLVITKSWGYWLMYHHTGNVIYKDAFIAHNDFVFQFLKTQQNNANYFTRYSHWVPNFGVFGLKLVEDYPANEDANLNQNIALLKPTIQSTTGSGGVSSRAVDGNSSGRWFSSTLTHTNSQSNPWWRVDLQNTYAINTIKVFNRTDCCSSRLIGAKLLVGTTDSNNPDDYEEVATLTAAAEQTFNLTPTLGRYVRVYIPGSNKILTLSEVEVYGELQREENENVALLKPTTQSTTGSGGVSSRAVDGNSSGRWFSGTLTHTNSQSNPWWRVDLQNTYSIYTIKVFNRTDCCSSRLIGAKLLVGTTDSNNPDDYEEVATLTAASVHTFNLNPILGRYVRVYIPGNNKILTLSEVEVYGELQGEENENVALLKPTTQSTTGSGGVSSRAVDGNNSGYWSSSTLTHTNSQSNPWWRVDLENTYVINSIKVFNRIDCCSGRLIGAKLLVGTTDSNNPDDYEEVATLTAAAEQTFNLTPTLGRYVRIYIPGSNKILTLSEVEVYGALSDDIALRSLVSNQPEELNKTVADLKETTLQLYPNPATNYFYLSSNTDELPNNIEIYNSYGINVTSKVIINNNINTKLVIDVSNLISGIYIVKSSTSSKILYKK